MIRDFVTKPIIKEISNRYGFTETYSFLLIEYFFKSVRENILNGHGTTIPYFGSIYVKARRARFLDKVEQFVNEGYTREEAEIKVKEIAKKYKIITYAKETNVPIKKIKIGSKKKDIVND